MTCNAKWYGGWMRNNPWEPWCLVVPKAIMPGDALHAMRTIKADAEKRGCLPSICAMPEGETPALPMSRNQLRKLRRNS